MMDQPTYKDTDVYDLIDLNSVVQLFVNNDNEILDIVVALQAYLTTNPFPPGSGILTPLQLQAAINTIYGSGSTQVRLYPVVPPDPVRSIQEDVNTLGVEPFLSLIKGAKLQPAQWLPILQIFTILKGITYLVIDGPDYETEPTYIKDGSYFLTTV